MVLLLAVFFVFPKILKSNPTDWKASDPRMDQTIYPTKQPVEEDLSDYYYPVAALPEQSTVQEEYRGIKLTRTPKSTYQSEQLALIKYFIDMSPPKLVSPGPKNIITFSTDEVNFRFDKLMTSSALASGENIYFNNKSFSGGMHPMSDDSVDRALETFIHELTHISQYYSITPGYLKSAKKSGIEPAKLLDFSPLVENFARSVGWEKTESSWKLKDEPETQKTTDYGKEEGPVEDMADSVAAYAMDKNYLISSARQEWVKNWLGENERLLLHKLPITESMVLTRFLFQSPISFNDEKEFEQKYFISDTLTYSMKTIGLIDSTATQLNQQLQSRGWQGSLTRSEDKNKVVFYKGEFIGQYRDLRINIRSYDQATGYKEKPDGTQIGILSGYKL